MSNDIGYGKPPKATRWEKGQSGNPKGRPKRALNIKTDLTDALGEIVLLRAADGSERRITRQQAMVKALTAKAAQGDVKAVQALLALMHRVLDPPVDEPGTPPAPAPDDVAIVEAFLASCSKKESD